MDGWGPESVLGSAVLIAAVVLNGLLAGVFFAFACSVVPGLRRIGDAAYLESFRAMNAAILNGWFLTVFMLAPLAGAAAAVFSGSGMGRVWIIAGAVCSVICFVITASVNVPLNRALEAAPLGTDSERSIARKNFEAPWNRAHRVRTIASTAALVLFALGCLSL